MACSNRLRVLVLPALAFTPASIADFRDGFEDPALVLNEIESNDPIGADWIEFHNPTPMPQDVSGWSFSDSGIVEMYTFAPGTVIPAGGYIVLEEDGPGSFTFGLGSTDEVILFDPALQISDRYAWATHAAGTYARCPNGRGPFVDVLVATKGTANTCPP